MAPTEKEIGDLQKRFAERASMEFTDAAVCMLHGKYDDALKCIARGNAAAYLLNLARKVNG